ncbi:hypothetical protein [Methanimicrococcus blatticola]|uniref:Uncharacterized protein n=1 Tax=Methanimicrococcus blatticola TaxID=91560 RepID=A0A484F930_9EURY|nr:hypothetical protein [Methanimicrococcus blatticola]MBZ3935089.1 hypothetical protein [Methanimicrococcus blatticola]MCC2508814.1 hypothetical protein [Methanimicrococcus blatticola]TDQ71157.1 hypothetical protein C7391_0261 [Methanimicrococcus blatticola]
MDDIAKHLLALQDKMEKMTDDELVNFVNENYPEAGWCGKRKLVTRKILTFERMRVCGDKDLSMSDEEWAEKMKQSQD